MQKNYFLIAVLFFFLTGNAQIVNIPDANFEDKLFQLGLDTNNDMEIQVSEIEQLKELDVSNSNISDLTGIQAFTGLQILNCSQNSLTFLDASGLTNLTMLQCFSNQIVTLYLSDCSLLTYLNCSINAITSLNLSWFPLLEKLYAGFNNISYLNFFSNHYLTELYIGDNHLTNVDVNYLTNLRQLNVGGNQLTTLQVDALTNLVSLQCWPNFISTIDVSNLNQLFQLDMRGNRLSSLDVSHNQELSWLFVANNQLTSIDVSANYNLTRFYCHANPMTTINVSNLENLQDFYFGNSPALETVYMKNEKIQNTTIYSAPNLHYICADESEIASIQAAAGSHVVVDSLCSFTPGGNYNILHGSLTTDINGNGCDSQDMYANTVKFNVNGSLVFAPTRISHPNITNNDYFLPLAIGTNLVEPVLDNPTYFQVDPASVSVDFSSEGNPLLQNFCISPLGIHPDIEVVVFALEQPSPGMRSEFKIRVKNKGNQVVSSEVNFSFNPQQANFSAASQTPLTNTAGNLSFLISNLNLFQEVVIYVSLELHTPTQSNPVIGGDILSVTVNGPLNQDETPLDNTFTLNEIVVNSYDPNDKICLEGATVSPDKIGDYVHYMIRFENTGTAEARKIIVTDIIDAEKYDISSLIPIDGSHSFETKISEGNKVEFIFQNINLPFEDEGNDGYVVFKIKIKPHLVAGDSFSNSASIYFDYNFPIITEPAVTTIAVLENKDFEFSDYFRLYPNPANEVLNVTSIKGNKISSVSIYNTLGQLVLVVTDVNQSIDVSGLKSGNYFIRIYSDSRSSYGKFIK